MRNTNEMELIFDSLSANEGFARVAVAAFMTQLNPTVEEVADVKTAISEAVTNAVIHGYENEIHKIFIRCNIKEETIYIEVEDGERLKRAIAREEQQKTPKYEEMCRRFLADSEDFSEERIAEAGIDRRFYNGELETCLKEVMDYIRQARRVQSGDGVR